MAIIAFVIQLTGGIMMMPFTRNHTLTTGLLQKMMRIKWNWKKGAGGGGGGGVAWTMR